jgi:peptidyl-prolyl cis-trans isomerase D
MFKRLIRSKTLRRRTSWVIAAILILPFVIFFHATGQAPTRGPGGTAGVVFGKRIPWETWGQQQGWILQKLGDRAGEIPSEAFVPLVHQEAWNNLLLLAEAKRERLRVTDEELALSIQRGPLFQDEGGRFRPDYYWGYLQSKGMTPQQFEHLVRQDLLIEKLTTSVKASVSVSDEEVKAAYANAHERLQASVLVVQPDAFRDEAATTLTDEEVRAYYETHPDEFRLLEQIKLECAGASREELAARVELGEEGLRAFYQDYQAEFAKEEGALTPFEEVKDAIRQHLTQERVRKQLTALALDLEEDVEAALPFEDIVKSRALTQYSAGPLPAGDLWIPNGPEPAVLQAVAELGEGQMSRVIETDNGVYIARVTQRFPSRVPLFDEVRAQIREQLVQERAKEAARKAAEALRVKLTELRAAGLRFEEALHKDGAIPPRPASFTRTEPIDPFGFVPAVNRAAFDTPLGNLTDVIETASGFVIVRPEARLPSDPSLFAQEEAVLRQETLAQKQAAHFERWLKDLRSRAKLQSFVEPPT